MLEKNNRFQLVQERDEDSAINVVQNKRNSNRDSQSFSLESHDSINDKVVKKLKKSLELRSYESESDTVDLGQSASKSHLSVNQTIHGNYKLTPNKSYKLSHIRNSTLDPSNQSILQK